MGALAAFGLIFYNLHAISASPALCIPKCDIFKEVSDCKAVNLPIKNPPWVIPYREAEIGGLLGAMGFGRLDL